MGQGGDNWPWGPQKDERPRMGSCWHLGLGKDSGGRSFHGVGVEAAPGSEVRSQSWAPLTRACSWSAAQPPVLSPCAPPATSQEFSF